MLETVHCPLKSVQSSGHRNGVEAGHGVVCMGGYAHCSLVNVCAH